MSVATSVPVVSSGSEKISGSVERTAVRFVRTWGFSTVETVAGHFRILAKSPAPRASLARRALASLPDLAWLDPTREWFTLLDRDSMMRASIEKVVNALGVVDRDDLELALGKRHSFGAAPPRVVRAYVETLAARVARQGAICENVVLSLEEQTVLEAFERLGGAAELEPLRAETRLQTTALRRVLDRSPLFLRASRASYRLVGAFAVGPAPAAARAPEWRAAV
jgi:hypothetical protein